jgi:hypothetical protein
MCHDSSGNIYLAGELPDTSGSSAVFKWNGNSWSSIGSFGGSLAIQYNPYAVDIHQLCADSHGNIYAITYCSSPGIYGVGTVQMWNGVLWNDISPYNLNGGYFYTTADNHGNIYLMGSNSTLGRSDIEKWNGTSWTEIMTIPNGIEFYGMCMDTFGDLYISGLFSDSIGRHCNLAVRKPNGYVVYDSSGFNITAMTITPQNRLCLSSDSGYYEWGGTSWHFVQFEGYCYTADRAGVICGDYAGNIYLGTGGAGVSVNFGGSVDDTRTGSGCIAEYHDSYGVFIDTIGTYFDTTDTHTSVKQLGDNRIDIYPNPTNGALILQFNNGISGVVCISDIEGQQLRTWTISNKDQMQINIDDLSDGAYIVSLELAEGTKQSRIIIKQ